jgi:predicted permease
LAVALALAAGSVLAVRSYRALRGIDPGFATEGVLTAHVPLGYTFSAEEGEHERRELDRLLARLAALPGVESAGAVLMRPLEMELGWDFTYTAEGQDPGAQERNPLANLLSATPGYFPAMDIRVLHGRPLDPGDDASAPKVALVSASFARRTWGDPAAAVGRRIKAGKPDSDKPWIEVVGVVEDVRYRALTTEKADVYLPYGQSSWRPNYLALRTDGDAARLVPAVERVVRELLPAAPLANPRTTAQLVGAKLAQPRLDALVLALLSASGVLLAALGVYAALAYLVRQRRRELGVRLALGASPRDLLAHVLGHSARLLAIGGALGAAAALAGAQLLAGWLHQVPRLPAGEVALAGGVLVLLAFAGAALPARRAARTDPMVTLR